MISEVGERWRRHLFPTTDTPMKKLTLTQKEMMKLAEIYLWAEAMDYTLGMTGVEKRLKKTEYNLPRLVEKGALMAVRHGKKLVYTIPNKRTKYSADIEHGQCIQGTIPRPETDGDHQLVCQWDE